jgi:hypothetical protein
LLHPGGSKKHLHIIIKCCDPDEEDPPNSQFVESLPSSLVAKKEIIISGLGNMGGGNSLQADVVLLLHPLVN